MQGSASPTACRDGPPRVDITCTAALVNLSQRTGIITTDASALWLKLASTTDAVCSADRDKLASRLALRLRKAFPHHGTAQVSCYHTSRSSKPQYMYSLVRGSSQPAGCRWGARSAQHASAWTRCGPPLPFALDTAQSTSCPLQRARAIARQPLAALPPAPTPAARRPRSSRTQICAMAGARSFLVRWHARAGLLCAPPQLPPGAVLLPACPELAPGVATP